MTRTEERTVSEDDRGSDFGQEFESRDGNGDIGGFSDEFDIAETQGASSDKGCRDNRLPVNKGPVCGPAVPDDESVSGDVNLAMNRGNGFVFDLKIVLRRASQPVGSQPELQHAPFKPLGHNQ
jgi:hypothetical protein